MKISIVTVTYNCESTIEETILSIINQSYQNIEYIIIDGNSKDKTLSIIQQYETKISKIINEPDKGIFDAMNKSLNYITGDYVIFINAGDRLVNNHIIADIFEGKNYTEDLIYGDTYIHNQLGFQFFRGDNIYSKNPTKSQLTLDSQGFCHQSLFTKVSILQKIRFNLSYPLGADYDTTAKIFYTGNHKIRYIGLPISIFDDRFGGASHNQIKRVLDERIQMFSPNKNIFFWIKYYKLIYQEKLKSILKIICPNQVKKIQEKKYKKKI